MTETYDTAQICPNGHTANSYHRSLPQFDETYCSKCGEHTMDACPSCHEPIRGSYRDGMDSYVPPAFCIHCGNRFPWTDARIRAVAELARILELSTDDQQQLEISVRDMVVDSPASTVGVARFKTIMAKAGTTGATMFREILIDVVTESAKRLLWPTP
jgi:hypothetical protein